MLTVRIKTEGCALRPHNTLWEVDYDHRGFLQLAGLRNCYVPEHWVEIVKDENKQDVGIIDENGFKHADTTALFGKTTTTGVTLNKFRTMGYFHDGSKSGAFTDAEYSEFENYLKLNGFCII